MTSGFSYHFCWLILLGLIKMTKNNLDLCLMLCSSLNFLLFPFWKCLWSFTLGTVGQNSYKFSLLNGRSCSESCLTCYKCSVLNLVSGKSLSVLNRSVTYRSPQMDGFTEHYWSCHQFSLGAQNPVILSLKELKDSLWWNHTKYPSLRMKFDIFLLYIKMRK